MFLFCQEKRYKILALKTMQKRINKYISETGFCSRREADRLIEAGRVTINGVKPEMGTKVNPEDTVEIDGKVITKNINPIYLAFNKPEGITSTTDLKDRDNIIDFINFKERIFPIGRLDKPSEGLIFMTNDGDIVNKILRAGNNHEKEYIVRVDKSIDGAFIDKMSNGVPILDTVTQKCFVEKLGDKQFKIILTQGLNRQIRRMCEELGYKVYRLTRTRVMNITTDGLPSGRWRHFTEAEIKEVNELVASSIKTEEASQLERNDEN